MKAFHRNRRFSLFALIALIVLLPRPAISDSLSLRSSWDQQASSQTGPDNTLQLIGDIIGVSLLPNVQGSAYVTGTSMWAAAPSYAIQNTSWYEVWKYGETQTNIYNTEWAALYNANGNPGDSLDVTLNYTYDNYRVNLTADARSESKSSLLYWWGVLPASNTYTAQTIASFRNKFLPDFMLCSLGFQSACDELAFLGQFLAGFESSTLSYDQNYHFASFTWSDDSQSGSIDLGLVPVGSQFFVGSVLLAQADAQAYGPGVVVTVEDASTRTNLVATVIPAAVPEPASLLLVASGLAGFAGVVRRTRRGR
jgi:hypothetical protein